VLVLLELVLLLVLLLLLLLVVVLVLLVLLLLVLLLVVLVVLLLLLLLVLVLLVLLLLVLVLLLCRLHPSWHDSPPPPPSRASASTICRNRQSCWSQSCWSIARPADGALDHHLRLNCVVAEHRMGSIRFDVLHQCPCLGRAFRNGGSIGSAHGRPYKHFREAFNFDRIFIQQAHLPNNTRHLACGHLRDVNASFVVPSR
jgi:hypothetical protein